MKRLAKKVISGVLSTAMMALCATSLTACKIDETPKTTNSSFNYETDMQYIYYGTGGRYEPMTKSDTGYYYVGEHDMIIYIDKESQKATPLCSKPNCLHSDPEACDAYFDLATDVDVTFFTMSVPIQYYKGNLYMVTKQWSDDGLSSEYYLTKTNKSGKNAENITKPLDFSVCKWMIHRGYFYYATDYSIQRIDLDNPKSKPEKIFTLSEGQSYEGSQNAFHSIIAYGDYIYFRVFNNSVDNKNTSSFTMPCFYSLNTSTLESVRLEHQNEEVGIDTFYNDKLIFHIVKNGKLESYMSDLNGDNPEKIEMGDLEKSYISSDGMYLYYVDKAKSLSSESAPMITPYDLNMKQVDTFKLAEKGNDKLFSPQDERFFVYINKDENGENQLVLADKSQIGNVNGGVIEYKTLCKLNWYEVPDVPYIVSSGEEVKPDNDRFVDNQ